MGISRGTKASDQPSHSHNGHTEPYVRVFQLALVDAFHSAGPVIFNPTQPIFCAHRFDYFYLFTGFNRLRLSFLFGGVRNKVLALLRWSAVHFSQQWCCCKHKHVYRIQYTPGQHITYNIRTVVFSCMPRHLPLASRSVLSFIFFFVILQLTNKREMCHFFPAFCRVVFFILLKYEC